MNDRTSHWPIYDIIPIELIKVVSGTIREATTEVVKSKDGLVVYFPKREGERGLK